MAVLDILNEWTHYSGDNPHEKTTKPHFKMTRIENEGQGMYYLLEDKVACTFVQLHLSKLRNPHFDLISWYDKQLCEHRHIPYNKKCRGGGTGDALLIVAGWLLQDSINTHYPSTTEKLDPKSHFYIHLKDYRPSVYIIKDVDLNIQTAIETKDLKIQN